MKNGLKYTSKMILSESNTNDISQELSTRLNKCYNQIANLNKRIQNDDTLRVNTRQNLQDHLSFWEDELSITLNSISDMEQNKTFSNNN